MNESQKNQPEEKPQYPYDELMPFEAYFKLFKWYTRKLIWVTGFWSILIAIIDFYRNFQSSFSNLFISILVPAILSYMFFALFFLHVFKTHSFYAGSFGLRFKDFWLFVLAALVCILFLNSLNIAVWISDLLNKK